MRIEYYMKMNVKSAITDSWVSAKAGSTNEINQKLYLGKNGTASAVPNN